MGAIPIHAAIEAAGQANADLLTALDQLSADSRISDRMALASCLQSLSYVLAHGLTPEARKRCESSRAMIRATLGGSDDT